MPPYEPSAKTVHAFLDPEASKALSLPLAALITGALSQVESTIELTDRVCDPLFHCAGIDSRQIGRGAD
jgi:hypothetical protein